MSTIPITLKWGSRIFSNFEIHPSETGKEFKEAIAKVTGVLPEDQSVICKQGWSGLLENDYVFTSDKIVPQQKIILIGITRDQNHYRFDLQGTTNLGSISSMNANDSSLIKKNPPGLININNSCYINAVIQLLHQVPEVVDAVQSLASVSISGTNEKLLFELGELFKKMKKSETALYPSNFVKEVRMSPKFNEMTRTDYARIYKQQDADEFLSYLLSACQSVFRKNVTVEQNENTNKQLETDSIIDDLFDYTVTCKYECMETDEVQYTEEHLNKLYCNIDGGAKAKIQVNNIYDGIQLSQESIIEKHSDKLGKNAQWKKTTTITELPQYFYIQMVRFYWKEDPSEASGGYPCKIMRAVAFPDKLDAMKFIDPEKAKKLAEYRSALNDPDLQDSLRSVDDKYLKESLCESVCPYENALGPHLPLSFIGKYSLAGIVSHKGDRLDSGHYVSWIRMNNDNYDQWYKCDDNEVKSVYTDDIKNLKGGSENHSAYILLYKREELF
ncbi:hypothetical protein WA158_002703 [Blastocystis sp. Blastoise]